MTRLTNKGIHTVKRQNHLCTIIPPKSGILRTGGYKCRTLEMNLQLREQLKTISYAYRLLYQNFRVTANQKSTIDTQIRKSNPNTTLKIVIKAQEKRRREEKRTTKTNPNQLTKWQ